MSDNLPSSHAMPSQGNTRLEAFIDATFAFAVTLLVISAERIPDSVESLLLALKALPSFAMSFAMIAMFWYAHVSWSRRFPMHTVLSLLLSLLLVFLVLVYVYPLRLLFGIFFSWISGGWLPMPLSRFAGPGDLILMYIVYGVAFISMSACMAALYAHTWLRRQAQLLAGEEARAAAGEVASYLFLVAVGLLSVGVAMLLPARPEPWLLAVPGAVYFILCFTGRVDGLGRRWATGRLDPRATDAH